MICLNCKHPSEGHAEKSIGRPPRTVPRGCLALVGHGRLCPCTNLVTGGESGCDSIETERAAFEQFRRDSDRRRRHLRALLNEQERDERRMEELIKRLASPG